VPFATFQLHSPKADVERTFDHCGFVPDFRHGRREAFCVLSLTFSGWLRGLCDSHT
jgi:hypothetical protein